MLLRSLAFAVVVSMSACKGGDAGAKPEASAVTIVMGPDGKATVQGGSAMKGDPKACASFKACCSHPSMGMFCGLVQASETDCSKARDSAKQQLKEQGLKAPVGCL